MRAECGLGAAADEAPSDELARLFAMVDLDGSGAIRSVRARSLWVGTAVCLTGGRAGAGAGAFTN